MTDDPFMARALDLAHGVRRRTAPNPWVGCVIVRDGTIVGEGATSPPGGAHAEAAALAAAGERARGATVFTTLEPCSHQGRTGRAPTRSSAPAWPGSSAQSKIPTRTSPVAATRRCAPRA